MHKPHLKNYQKRRLARARPKTVEFIVIIGVIAIVDILLKGLKIDLTDSYSMIISFGIVLLLIIFFRAVFFDKLKTKEYFLTGFGFRDPKDDNTISAAIEGIFSFSKSQPYFIHVTPPNEEITEIINAFEEGGKNFIHIHGKPGEGKSMLAYHAIYKLQKGSLRYNYLLNIEALADKNKDIIKDILNELDGLRYDMRAPSLKLILIDDAHRLPFSYELEKQFRIEAKQGNGCFIWITTELEPFDKMKKKTGELSINFQSYYMKLVKTLYNSTESRIQKLMFDKFPKLPLAIEQTKKEIIKDVWTFNFVASDGFKKMKEDLLSLKDEESYILYLLSANTTITGENPLTVTEFFNFCMKYKPVWFQISFSEFQKYLKELSEQKSEEEGRINRRRMLRLIKDNLNNVTVESLHSLFAFRFLEEVSKTISSGRRYEILNATKALLSDDWGKYRYLGTFLICIGNDSSIFFQQNAEWLKQYFENFQQSHLNQYESVVVSLQKHNKPLFNDIFTDTYFNRYSAFFSQLQAYRFNALANFIRSFPREMNSKLVGQLNINALAETISNAPIENFAQVACLINSCGRQKEELIKKINLTKILKKINNASIESLGQAGCLINSLGSRKEELLKELNLINIIKELNNATIENIHNATSLINSLGSRKEKLLNEANFIYLIEEINNTSLINFGKVAELINAMGDYKEKLLNEISLTHIIEEISNATIENLEQAAVIINAYGNHKEELIKELLEKKKLDNIVEEISNVSIENFSQAASIINAFGKRKEELIKEIIEKKKLDNIVEEISNAAIENFSQTANIINAFGKRKEELIKEIIEKKKLDNIVEEISNVSIENFSQAASIINAFGKQKAEILKEIIENKKLDKIVEEINNADIENFGQAEAIINAFGKQKEKLFKEIIEKKKLNKIIEEISNATIINFGQAAALLNAFGSYGEELIKELIEKKKLDKIIDEISTATIENFGQTAYFINAFGNKKEELIKELIEKKKLDKIIKEISSATIANFGQAAAIINAFGNHKEKLLIELIEKKKLDKIIEGISNATNENLEQVAALINAFGDRKEELSSRINFSNTNS